MRVACPHCGEMVDVTPRHGLSGSLCPACHEVVPALPQTPTAPTPAPSRLPPTPSRPPRDDPWLGCDGCGGGRDRDARRCPACGESWLFRVMVVGGDGEDRLERLAEYVAKRQMRAESRARLRKRLGRPPAEVLGQLTETQARRVRQEVEAFGVKVTLERDPTVIDQEATAPRFHPGLVWFAAGSAVALLVAGLYLFVGPFDSPPRTATAAPATAAPPSLVAAPASAGPGAPVDVLAGLARPAAGAGLAFFVDPDGWAVAPLRLRDPAGGTELRTESGAVRAALARGDAARGLGLFHAPARAPYALSFGDATRLEPGAKLYVPVATENSLHLTPAAVVAPNHRVGREVFLRLGLDPGAAADGAPIFNTDGLVVGVYQHALTRAAGVPLAVPSNALTEGAQAIMSEIVPPRPPSERLREWREAARAADRAARPELYDLAERALLAALSCHPAGCSGHLGVIAFDGAPPDGPLEALFFAPAQVDEADAPAFGRRLVPLAAQAWGPDAGPLASRLSEEARSAIAAGEAHLTVAAIGVERPAAAEGGAFRLVLQGLGGRRAAPISVEAAAPAPASIAPGAERFGPFTGEEWRGRLQRLVDDTEAARARLSDLRRAESEGHATPGTRELLERESAQLAILQQRLTTLIAEADTYHVPPQFRP